MIFQLSIKKKKKTVFITYLFKPLQNFRLVQIETSCTRNFKVHLKWKISTV